MSIFDTTKRAFGSGYDDYDDYDGYDDEMYDDEYEEEKPRRKSFFSFFSKKKDSDSFDDDYEEDLSERSGRDLRSRDYSRDYSSRSYSGSSRGSYSASSRGTSSSRGASSQSSIRYASDPGEIEVKVLYPTSFDDSAELVREVKAGKITIFDVSGIPSNEDARRVVDYISGAAAGMECPFSRLCPSIFCIAPKGVRLNNTSSRYKT